MNEFSFSAKKFYKKINFLSFQFFYSKISI
jgi:hypothetical protein